MRVEISATKQARAGDLVRVVVRKPKTLQRASVSVWSAIGDCDEFSPHVPADLLGLASEDGKPELVQPIVCNVNILQRRNSVEFTADEPMQVKCMMRIDGKNAPRATARIKVYGTTRQEIRRFMETIRRSCRNLYHKATAAIAELTGRVSV